MSSLESQLEQALLDKLVGLKYKLRTNLRDRELNNKVSDSDAKFARGNETTLTFARVTNKTRVQDPPRMGAPISKSTGSILAGVATRTSIH